MEEAARQVDLFWKARSGADFDAIIETLPTIDRACQCLPFLKCLNARLILHGMDPLRITRLSNLEEWLVSAMDKAQHERDLESAQAILVLMANCDSSMLQQLRRHAYWKDAVSADLFPWLTQLTSEEETLRQTLSENQALITQMQATLNNVRIQSALVKKAAQRAEVFGKAPVDQIMLSPASDILLNLIRNARFQEHVEVRTQMLCALQTWFAASVSMKNQVTFTKMRQVALRKTLRSMYLHKLRSWFMIWLKKTMQSGQGSPEELLYQVTLNKELRRLLLGLRKHTSTLERRLIAHGETPIPITSNLPTSINGIDVANVAIGR